MELHRFINPMRADMRAGSQKRSRNAETSWSISHRLGQISCLGQIRSFLALMG